MGIDDDNGAGTLAGSDDKPERCEMLTVNDPFIGHDVQISARLVDRLRGKYACGPHLPNGNPEFGWRQFEAPPIQHEAAARIEELEAIIARDDKLDRAIELLWAPTPEMLTAACEAIDKVFGRGQANNINRRYVTWSDKHTARWQSMLRAFARERGIKPPAFTVGPKK